MNAETPATLKQNSDFSSPHSMQREPAPISNQEQIEEGTALPTVNLPSGLSAAEYKTLGNTFQLQGHLNVARECYVKAIELQPKFAEAYGSLGTLYAQQKQWSEAIVYYTTAMTIQPECSGFHRNLARVWQQLEQLEKAVECWCKAIALEPTQANFEELLILGNQLEERGKIEEAISCYRHTIHLNSEQVVAYKKLGKLLLEKGEREEAVSLCRRVVQLCPTSEEAYNELGDALVQQQYWEEAIFCYQRAIEMAPESSFLYPKLGLVLAKAGKMEEAIAVYRQTIELNLDYPAHRFFNEVEGVATFQVNAQQLHRVPGQIVTYDSLPMITSLNSNQGWVFYGPYLNLTDGLYRVRVYFDFPEQTLDNQVALVETVGFKFDLVTDYGQCIWYETEVYTHQDSLEFIVELIEAPTVEFRFGSTGVTFAVNYIELTCLYEPGANANYYGGLGHFLASKGLQSKAIAAYRHAIELSLEAGDREAALTCYQTLLENHQELAEASPEIALLLVQTGLVNEVIECCNCAFNCHPDRADFYYNLGIFLAEQGLKDEATLCFQRTPQRPSSKGEAYEYIWKGLNQLGPLDEASPYCQIEIDSDVVFEYFKQKNQCKIIEMEALTQEDRVFLENAGFSIAILELMRKDHIALEEFYINSFDKEPPRKLSNKIVRDVKTPIWHTLKPTISHQQSIVETGYIYHFARSVEELSGLITPKFIRGGFFIAL
ncbi:MAG: tetratricopeptide repeat protein [Actinomycetota bacterium]